MPHLSSVCQFVSLSTLLVSNSHTISQLASTPFLSSIHPSTNAQFTLYGPAVPSHHVECVTLPPLHKIKEEGYVHCIPFPRISHGYMLSYALRSTCIVPRLVRRSSTACGSPPTTLFPNSLFTVPRSVCALSTNEDDAGNVVCIVPALVCSR